jgi:hypothetical protein
VWKCVIPPKCVCAAIVAPNQPVDSFSIALAVSNIGETVTAKGSGPKVVTRFVRISSLVRNLCRRDRVAPRGARILWSLGSRRLWICLLLIRGVVIYLPLIVPFYVSWPLVAWIPLVKSNEVNAEIMNCGLPKFWRTRQKSYANRNTRPSLVQAL